MSFEMTNKFYTCDPGNECFYSIKGNDPYIKNFKFSNQHLNNYKKNGCGDSEIHYEMSTKSKNFQPNESLAAGECRVRGNPNLNYQPDQESEISSVKPEKTLPYQFTQKMIEEQEMLVSTLNQQGISEHLIRRHFDRLLEEQSQQLRLVNEKKISEQNNLKKEVSLHLKPQENNDRGEEKSCTQNYNLVKALNNINCSCCSHIAANAIENSQENQHVKLNDEESRASVNPPQNNKLHKVEPSSLLKIRLEKEVINTQKRNNGLQDNMVAQEIIQNYKTDKTQRSSKIEEYAMYAKLNGTQEKSKMENYQMMYCPDTVKKELKRSSHNGLENTRNPDNPRLAPKSAYVQQLMNEESEVMYPMQKYCHGYPNKIPYSCNNINREQTENYCNHNDIVFQTQNYNHKLLGFPNNEYAAQINAQNNPQHKFTYYPEFQEPKIIGGLTYIARKPQYITCNANIVNKH